MSLAFISDHDFLTGDDEMDYDLQKLRSLDLAASGFPLSRANNAYRQTLERAFWLRQLCTHQEAEDVSVG